MNQKKWAFMKNYNVVIMSGSDSDPPHKKTINEKNDQKILKLIKADKENRE